MIDIAHDADALRSAAQRLHDDSMDAACAPLAPAALAALEQALTTLSRTCYVMAQAFIPDDDRISDRYARAASEWPSAAGGCGPSHEQQARVLASLHEAGAGLRTAAARCGRAAGTLANTMDAH